MAIQEQQERRRNWLKLLNPSNWNDQLESDYDDERWIYAKKTLTIDSSPLPPPHCNSIREGGGRRRRRSGSHLKEKNKATYKIYHPSFLHIHLYYFLLFLSPLPTKSSRVSNSPERTSSLISRNPLFVPQLVLLPPLPHWLRRKIPPVRKWNSSKEWFAIIHNSRTASTQKPTTGSYYWWSGGDFGY